jgi:hypothetical protein
MTPGIRTHKQATLRLVVPEGLPEEMRFRVREIVSVSSGNPRKGQATALMYKVCREADKAGFVLLLEAKPFDSGMEAEQLQSWYERFGFLQIQPEPALMARQPRQ